MQSYVLPVKIFSGICYGDVKKGWWEGTKIVSDFTTQNELECGIRCCLHEACKLWVWRIPDKMCQLKKDDNITWYSASDHYAAMRNERKIKMSVKYYAYFLNISNHSERYN